MTAEGLSGRLRSRNFVIVFRLRLPAEAVPGRRVLNSEALLLSRFSGREKLLSNNEKNK